MTSRVIEVDPERFGRWLAGFAERHGPIDSAEESTPDGIVVRATAADGSSIVATPFAHEPLGLILVRRGGYAVGLAFGRTFSASKVGSRHVQSRTAAGGWSQQRFARRRANQADELVGAVVGHARRVLLGDDESPRTGGSAPRVHPETTRALPPPRPRGAPPGDTRAAPTERLGGIPTALVIGGDRVLVREVLAASALRALRDLPRRELYDLPDPKRAVLEAALRRGRAYRVELTEPEPTA